MLSGQRHFPYSWSGDGIGQDATPCPLASSRDCVQAGLSLLRGDPAAHQNRLTNSASWWIAAKAIGSAAIALGSITILKLISIRNTSFLD